jgi:2-polyprenyl-3-methyl-5-hydroxy-6-metoxy-1,4-benzoquinol methylase
MVYTELEPTPDELAAYYASYPAVSKLSPVTEKRYHELLDRFEPYRRANRIIDVGCGSGLFLRVAAQRGWEVHGTEYGAGPIEACKKAGIAIREGALDPENYPPGHFDVVCSFEVLEHLAHPAQEVERMGRILRKGGLLYATTPNFDCLARRLKPAEWNVVNFPEHLSYFAPRTFRKMFEDAGMETLWTETTGFSVSRWLSGRKVGETRIAAKAKQERLREELEQKGHLRIAKRMVNGMLNMLSLGDSMKGGFLKS